MEENPTTQIKEIIEENSDSLTNIPEISNEKASHGTPPKKPEGNTGLKGDENTITHKGAITFVEDANISGQTYTSNGDNEHAILTKGGNVTISNATITKSGNSNGDTADFYGTNAATIAINGTLELFNDKIITQGSHSNAVFAYGSGEIIIADTTITTKDNNSGGIMVTGGGTLSANNVTVTTEGNSSAAIRSDRGGGTINVDGGSYTTNGIGSPAIYSTADITVQNAELISTKSEGAIVEGKNSITLINSTLKDTNTSLNGQSTTYKNIFLYQSMSGDADEGTASFKAKNSKIITNNGDTIYVTNTTAKITLENNEIINTNGDFLRIEASNRGNEGNNGGDVTLSLINQNIKGNIVIDDISSLTMKLTEGSNFEGAINSANKSQNISIKIDNSSSRTLTSDSYISKISSNAEGYTNINLNGYTLYIGDNAITSVDQIPIEKFGTTTIELNKNTESATNYVSTGLILGGIGIIAIFTTLIICIKTYTKKQN